MTIYIVRGAHANQFELQNYDPLLRELDIKVVTSQHPLTGTTIPQIKLWSPSDLPSFPLRRQLLNRLIGGEQWLLGLENLIKSNGSIHRTGVIMHTAETYTPYTHQAVELRKAGKIQKLVCTCWETIAHNNEKFARLKKWKNEAYKYVDIFHTPTKRAKDALIMEGVSASKIIVIPYGVDLTRFRPPRVKHVNTRPRILTVSRLVPEKGIKVIYNLAASLPQLDFLVVGGDKSSDLPNLTYRVASYREMPDIYRQADIFLLPSLTISTWEEQYGMALVEAMACGLPIITTGTGAIPEVVGHAALIVSPQHLKSAIFELINNPTKRAQLSSRSINQTRELDVHNISHQLANLYQ